VTAHDRQRAVCARYGAGFLQADPWMVAGVARELKGQPAHGLRHPPTGMSSGWYLWTGKFSEADDFFKPLHISHVYEARPEIEVLLGLAPGWRFLQDGDYVDVWFDKAVLDI
jgi:hypothetical protein